MPNRVIQYDLLVSCPGDVSDAVNIVCDVVEEFNQQYSDTLGISLRIRYWEKSAFSESGGKPQELLNKQIVDSSDLAVVIFKSRFGSPTDNYGSGTEEEIEKMLAGGKQVFMFFDESPVSPSSIDLQEYERIKAFKDRYKDRGLYWTYDSLDSFKAVFRAHITRYFMTLDKTIDDGPKSHLHIKACTHGKLVTDYSIEKFDMGSFQSSESIRAQVLNDYDVINHMTIIKSASDLGMFSKKVELEDQMVSFLRKAAEVMKIELSDSFFDIGNLSESVIGGGPWIGKSLCGTDTEKEKYYSLDALKTDIHRLFGHMQMEEYYGDLYGIQLVLSNNGTDYDEDIDVEMILPKDCYLSISKLPVPKNEIDTGDDSCFADIFEIVPTKEYIGYSETKKKEGFQVAKNFTPIMPYASIDYEESYRETLEEIFEYREFEDENTWFVGVHFDYIKQHQTAAFPTWIFVKNPRHDFNLKYRITSKRSRDVIEETIVVKGIKED